MEPEPDTTATRSVAALSPEAEDLRDKFFLFLASATRPLWHGPDPEVALEALLDAATRLRDHLCEEMEALRTATD